MSTAQGFSAAWLQLREGADARARNRDLASALSAWFALRSGLSIVDLGSGTGSNLRAMAQLLPPQQSWRLIDADSALHGEARRMLRRWADNSEDLPDGRLLLEKGTARITVAFEQRDLAKDPEGIFTPAADLVTASALFDLVSEGYIKAFVRALASSGAAFYTVLTYNGLQKWAPHRPADNQMAAAFNRHQMSDKGFGTAAGPTAASLLADYLRLAGYSVQEGDSPWTLGPSDRMLIEELQRGHAMAVLETGTVDAKTVETWVKTIRSAAEIGHTDILALPTPTSRAQDF